MAWGPASRIAVALAAVAGSAVAAVFNVFSIMKDVRCSFP